jgi:hypothetical protein
MAIPRFLAAAVAVAVIGATAVAATAAVATPHRGTGTSTLTSSDVVGFKQVGGYTFVDQHNTRVDVGAFTGSVDEYLSLVIAPNGSITFSADATLHGTYAGCSVGTVTQQIHLTGRISPSDGRLDADFATFGGAPVKVTGTVLGNGASDTANFLITYWC